MAACIAKARGEDSNRVKDVQQLGSQAAVAQANTRKTFTTCHVRKDGSGYVKVERPKGNEIHRYEFEKE